MLQVILILIIIEVEHKPKYDLPKWEHHQVYAKNFQMPNQQLLLEPNS